MRKCYEVPRVKKSSTETLVDASRVGSMEEHTIGLP